jgi:gliding motility-associated lipoprotein GldD
MRKLALVLSIIIPLALACEEETFIPRPTGYFRMDFPEKKYERSEPIYPFTFEVPFYGLLLKAPTYSDSMCAINLEIPKLKATLHLTYLEIDNNVNTYFESCRRLAFEHRVASIGISEKPALHPENNVYGLVYDIQGEVASNMQFYATDSTNHFLRGALYFNAVPNIDSLQPSLDYLKDDIFHLLETLEWTADTLQK